MKTIITQKQFDSLAQDIYMRLMEHPDMGMGEMGDCKEAADILVSEWVKREGIEVAEEVAPMEYYESGGK